MALSFEEQMELQDSIDADLASLKQAEDFEEQLNIQDRMEAAVRKLVGTVVAKARSLYEQLVAGEFLKEPVVRFVSILERVAKEIGGDIKALHEPVIAYLAAHRSEDGVYENAGIPQDAVTILAEDGDLKRRISAVRRRPKESGAGDDILIDIDKEFESPDTFREIVRAIDDARSVDTVILKVNSHGGRTDSAQAVYVALLATKANTIAQVITAYSSGSLVTMPCDEIQTTPNCTMMIHNASAFSWGKVGDMKTQSTFLEEHFKKWFGELYAGFLTQEEIADVFKGQDIWLREEQIRERLARWTPIRRRKAQGRGDKPEA